MTEIDRAIAYVASFLKLSTGSAELLPVRVVRDLWAAKLDADRKSAEELRDGDG